MSSFCYALLTELSFDRQLVQAKVYVLLYSFHYAPYPLKNCQVLMI
jgi:hypothetical protein